MITIHDALLEMLYVPFGSHVLKISLEYTHAIKCPLSNEILSHWEPSV